MTWGDERTNKPWWMSAGGAVMGLIGLVSGALGLAPLLSSGVRNWCKAHALLGWWCFAGAVILGVAAIAVVRDRQSRRIRLLVEAATKDAQLRERECRADVTVVERRFGPFLSAGSLRQELDGIPSPKYFSHRLQAGFISLESGFTSPEPIFDESLKTAVEAAREAMVEYWGHFRGLLDGPPELKNAHYDLRILQPPGGSWKGRNEAERWESFYEFVRSLEPRQARFIRSLDLIESRLHRLRVEAGIL